MNRRLAVWLHRVFAKEPVMLGAAVIAVYEAAVPDASSAWKIAVGAAVAWIVRLLSTPEAAVRQREAAAHVEGYQAAADDLRSLPPTAIGGGGGGGGGTSFGPGGAASGVPARPRGGGGGAGGAALDLPL